MANLEIVFSMRKEKVHLECCVNAVNVFWLGGVRILGSTKGRECSGSEFY